MISEKEKYYIQAFISSNLDSMYKRTHSFGGIVLWLEN